MANRSEQPGLFRALLDALKNSDPSHYPRLAVDDDKVDAVSLTTRIVAEIDNEFRRARVEDANEEALVAIVEKARESLNEVKDLTEYQDAKIVRLLTVIAFLSALAGALFSRFADAHPLIDHLTNLFGDAKTLRTRVGASLVLLSYLAFSIYVLSAISGALISYHAIRTRFKWLSEARAEVDNRAAEPRSCLFFEGIL